jgi:hypothetical protein
MAKRKLNQTVRVWLPLAAITTVLSGLIYAAVQQNYRQNANDPQIQLATDAAQTLKAGANSGSVINTTSVDPAFSLSPFLITFDANGTVLSSSVLLAGSTPLPPSGVFAYAKTHGEDRFTWEPEPGVRIAAVVEHYSGAASGFVLAGRSLGEVENRESQLEMMTAAAWIVALGSSFVLMLIL